MAKRRFEQFGDRMARLFPELHPFSEDESKRVLTKTVTFQVTDDCNLACRYCFAEEGEYHDNGTQNQSYVGEGCHLFS